MEERLALRRLVGALGTVPAPPDFDFRLRARLAAVKGANDHRLARHGFAPGHAAIALAASFALVVALAVAFKQMTSNGTKRAPATEVVMTSPAGELQPWPIGPVSAPTISDNTNTRADIAAPENRPLLKSTVENRPRAGTSAFTGRKINRGQRAGGSSDANSPSIMSADFVVYNAQPGVMQPGKSNPAAETAGAQAGGRGQTADPFIARGAETVPLTPQAAVKLGARGGRLVVSVRPESAASRSGLRAGDVVETLDGRLFSDTDMRARLDSNSPAPLSLGVVRGNQKLQISLQK